MCCGIIVDKMLTLRAITKVINGNVIDFIFRQALTHLINVNSEMLCPINNDCVVNAVMNNSDITV